MTTGDGSNPGDDLDGDPGRDREKDVIERLRRLDPVDVESLPSSRRAEAIRTLEEIVNPDDDTEPS